MQHEGRSSIVNKPHPKTLVIAVAACLLGVVLALVGAEFPPDTSFVDALPFWLTIACTAAFLLTTVSPAIRNLVADTKLSPVAIAGLAGATTIALVTIPLAMMCLPIDTLMPDEDNFFEVSTANDAVSVLLWGWADQYLNLLPAVAGLWLFVKVLDTAFPAVPEASIPHGEGRELSDGSLNETAESKDHPQERKPSALERRFPEITGQTLLAIEADEHYVRLHTDAGCKHVLYRFRDALKDVEELAGLRVHRSWWVAEDAMEDIEQTASGFGIKLKGGLVAPVSQTYQRDVRRTIETR